MTMCGNWHSWGGKVNVFGLINQLLSVNILLKSNCKHVPADGVVHGQSKCELHVCKCFAYQGGDRKNVTDTKKVLKKDQQLNLKSMVTPIFYVMNLQKQQSYSTCHQSLVVTICCDVCNNNKCTRLNYQPMLNFHDFSGLENNILEFHDFLGFQ